MNRLICIALVALTGFVLNGCGLVSGTAFVSQDVDGRIESQAGTILDVTAVGHAVVDFTDNSDWQDFDIDGIEDGCIAMDAWNLLTTTVSGEVWITMDTTLVAINAIHSIADIQAAGGFRIFNGIALPAGQFPPANPDVDPPTHHFTCAETIALLENVDQLVSAIQTGYFVAWGIGNESEYHFVFDGIVFGVHVTGSL